MRLLVWEFCLKFQLIIKVGGVGVGGNGVD